jgi:CheY-like chemotaxis protein
LKTIERLLSRLFPEGEIIAALDADSALALLAAHPVSVALIDYRMPGMDGLALAAVIRRHAPAVQLILISAMMRMQSFPGGTQAHAWVVCGPAQALGERGAGGGGAGRAGGGQMMRRYSAASPLRSPALLHRIGQPTLEIGSGHESDEIDTETNNRLGQFWTQTN